MTFTTNLKEKPLPPGTRIVTLVNKAPQDGSRIIRRGSIGVVLQKLGEDMFEIKLPDDRIVHFLREEIQPQRDSFRVEHVMQELTHESIKPHVAFEFIVGSTAYGLAVPTSDEDCVGSYVLPSRQLWGLRKYQETVQTHVPDGTYHEIGKFIQLACKGNPNTIELGEIVSIPGLVKIPPQNEILWELFDRWYEIFVSKYVFSAYQSYAINQFKKIEQDLRNREEIRWKHACHLLRLLWSGAECMRTGRIVVRPEDSVREYLLRVRNGEITQEEFRECRLKFEREFQEAFDRTLLPEQANFEEANKLLIAIREREYRHSTSSLG